MVRFIIITFLFLGFAFFQLSGGTNFDPVATRMARVEVPENVEVSQLVPDAKQAEVDAEEVVTRVSLDLVKLEDVVRPEPTLRRVAARVVPKVEEPAVDVVAEQVAATIVLPSLIEGATTATVTPVDFSADPVTTPTATQSGDIRSVTGNRVNVRGGPSTEFGVVNSMSRGQQVLILEDPGNGWVRLRPVEGGPTGWMADFLLSKG